METAAVVPESEFTNLVAAVVYRGTCKQCRTEHRGQKMASADQISRRKNRSVQI